MNPIWFAIVGVAALAAAGCSQSDADGNGGPAVQRAYQVGSFERIEVAGPYDVNVRTGAAPAVSATGSQRALDRLVVEVSGNRLLIHPKERWGVFHLGEWHSDGNATIQMTAPSLTAATISGSGGLHIDKVSGNAFEGSVGGSGSLRVDQVAVQALKLSIGGSGDARAISGQASSIEYELAGSGGIDTRGVRAQVVKASIVGSGNVNGQATGSADINIVGAGDVTLTGGAKCTVHNMGSGAARCS